MMKGFAVAECQLQKCVQGDVSKFVDAHSLLHVLQLLYNCIII